MEKSPTRPPSAQGSIRDNDDQLHRTLGDRQVQFITIGAAMGTAIFVLIGTSLARAGPAGLLLSYTFYACILGLVNNSVAEMVVFMPISGSYIRMASKWVDDAFGFMAGWNFFFYQANLIPFEISAINIVLQFWRDDIPTAAVCGACVVLYCITNLFAVKYYGESEFWLAIGKLILIGVVFGFTFVTMCGGNPQHDAYGFRYWNNPGAFAEYLGTGALGNFQGFLAGIWIAVFTFAGPEYVGMVAGETKNPRKLLNKAFKTIYWRFGIFFIGSALFVGIVLPYNDPTLTAGSGVGAGGSPYVIAMQNMGIKGLPHVVNALLVTSIFSAGNAYTYCSTRTLYSLALMGHAPAIFKKCTKNGIPIYCFMVTTLFSLLSFLSVSEGTSQVITWLVNLTTASQLINYIVACTTYIFFHRAMKAQGIDRDTLPYKGWFQPYSAWIATVLLGLILCVYSYAMYLPGQWDIGSFFSYYTMCFVGLLTFTGWKVYWRTEFVKPEEADLVWDRPFIDLHEESLRVSEA
ncbi:amino acid transporter-like protein [Ilyonectria robusta]|uniref:amino acid transporter-like protein n=1 Tax=Ilyonectria robusta TaxID=1079257 RepID=UPI001E8E5F54|nr:amino acid transporter-like protein [Ilyonectria robusta]KAH8673231.1 amino acid transporter-like protein [Ilyonectria robusta]